MATPGFDKLFCCYPDCRRRFFQWFWRVWTGFDLKIGFSVKNDAEKSGCQLCSSFQTREQDGDASEGKKYQIKKLVVADPLVMED